MPCKALNLSLRVVEISALVICVLTVAISCQSSEGEDVVQGNPSSSAMPSTITSASHEEDTSYYGAATASVAERIYASDVVVRASLLSVSEGTLRFRAVEYLKGSGATEFTVNASTANRNAAWDGQEAVLFLSLPESGGASGDSGSTTGAFEFAETTAWNYRESQSYTGKLPAGHTIESQNPVWMPARSGGASGSTETGASEYITESTSPAGVSQPTISLTDLRAKIAWMEGGRE